MWYAGCSVEELVDTVAAIRLDNGATAGFGVFFDDGAWFADEHTGFHNFYGFSEAFTGGFDNANGIPVSEGFWADVVGFIEVTVEAAVVEGDIDVENIAVEEDAVIRNAMAYDFVRRGTNGLGEVNVV